MIRYCCSKQLTITEFDWPFQTNLDEYNRWVKMAQCIPLDELAECYYQGLSAEIGRLAKDARLVIGAVIIKHKLSLSDIETVLQPQENLYPQYLVGLAGYQMEAPFAPSLFVDIRKCMGESVFEGFHQAIIEEATPTHQGKLILDATVVEQAIRYPTDLSLLNEARELSEQIIDILSSYSVNQETANLSRKSPSGFSGDRQTKTPGCQKDPSRHQAAVAVPASESGAH